MKSIIFMAMSLVLGNSFAQGFYPEVLLHLDSYFSHHVIIAEKSTHQLHLFQNNMGTPKLIQSYKMVTGKKAGDKQYQGDHRTPEGVYFFTDFLTRASLLKKHGEQGKIYGVGAFVMDYPNPMDNLDAKTGNGIWLHSTNDETRIDKGLDSRGCVVAANKDLIDIARYIQLHRTSIIVVHELKYLNQKAWQTKKTELQMMVDNWLKAWQEEDLNSYIGHYHPLFRDPTRGRLSHFRNYKREIFRRPGRPKVEAKNISILTNGDYATVTFRQFYQSNTIQDLGKKTLYLKRDPFYHWKIVSERWSKRGINSEDASLAFRPSMRFFKTENPQAILREASGEN